MPSIEKLDEVTELISYILYSDYIKLDEQAKEVPLSAMIIARIESGKTAVINQFVPNDGILVMSDVTAYGLLHDYIEELKGGSIKRILIPDLINPVNRKQETVNTLITFFNSYISWEGVNSISTFALQKLQLTKPLRGSLLTTIAIADYKRLIDRLAATGFISRLIPISYFYSDASINDILLDMAYHQDKWLPVRLALPKGEMEITLESELAVKLIRLAKGIGQQAGAYGLRAMKQLMVLAKCRALSQQRTEVNNEDIDQVSFLAIKYIKLPEGTEGIKEL